MLKTIAANIFLLFLFLCSMNAQAQDGVTALEICHYEVELQHLGEVTTIELNGMLEECEEETLIIAKGQ